MFLTPRVSCKNYAASSPDLPNVPVQPVIIASQDEPGMFDFYRGFRSFLPVHRYDTPAQLLSELSDRVIEPSEAKALEFRSTPSEAEYRAEGPVNSDPSTLQTPSHSSRFASGTRPSGSNARL